MTFDPTCGLFSTLSVIVLPLPWIFLFTIAMQITSSGNEFQLRSRGFVDSFEIFERRVRSPEAKRLIKSIIGRHRAARLIRRVLNRSTFRGFVFRSDRAGIDRVIRTTGGAGTWIGSP